MGDDRPLKQSGEQHDGTADDRTGGGCANKIAPITQKQTDALADLKPADDIKADWTQFVDRQKQLNELLITIRDKAEAKDRSGVQDFAKGQRAAEKMETEAAAVGATECAQG